MGRTLERQGKLEAAGDSYSQALRLEPENGTWLRKLAKLHEQMKDWEGAAANYREVVALDPDRKEWHLALGQAFEKAREPLRAVEAYTRARERFGDEPHLLRKLAGAYDRAGDWNAAREVLNQLIAANPEDSDAHYRMANCLDKLGSVPFRLSGGKLQPADTQGLCEAATAHFETSLASQPKRVTWLHRLAGRLARRKRLIRIALRVPILASRVHRRVSRPETRLRRLHDLGWMYEQGGRLEEAAKSYRSAVAGLETADSIWVHKAEPAWRFRLAYVERRLAPESEPDTRLDRAVVLRDAEEDGSASAEPGGFFEAAIVDLGLHVEGFLLPGSAETVDIRLGGELIKGVAANPKSWLRTFSFDLSHKVLEHLPASTRLTLSSGDRPLLAAQGCRSAEIHVPGGSGRLPELLESGYTVSKKGVLAAPPEEIEDRQLRYLKSYCEAKDKVEEVLGKKLFLLYGTLLGCYRDRAFIAGDDDFDVAYISDAADPVELKAELQEHALALLRAGYDVSITVTGRLFKVRLDRTWLDVNALWFYRNRAWAFDAHDLSREDFEPVETMEFLGHDVYVPRNIEAFLRDNYGPDWRVPQPDFRYYRAEEDRRILRRSWLTPSEAREFARSAEVERSRNPAAGTFVGIGDPADTGFSI